MQFSLWSSVYFWRIGKHHPSYLLEIETGVLLLTYSSAQAVNWDTALSLLQIHILSNLKNKTKQKQHSFKNSIHIHTRSLENA